jgi:SAM-dependent methyltransferase
MLDLWTEVSGGVPKSILEIGCGTGRYFTAFKQLGVNWRGIEINKEMLAYCIANGIPAQKIDIANDNISEKFDVVFMSQVLEHVLEPKKFMQKIGALLNLDGVFHLDVPNHDSLTSLYRRVNPIHQEYGFVQPNHHLIAYTKKSLTTLLENAGFKVEIIGAYANDHDVFGQLMTPKSPAHNMVLALSRLTRRGSILAAVAKRK